MRRVFFFSFSPLLIWLPIIPVALSKAVNRSIDDTLGDSVTRQRPLFLPSTVGIWEDVTCKECALRPSIQDAYDQTWTAATYRPPMGNMSISFPFTGTAIYVFFILSNVSSENSTTAANFTLDGVVEDAYRHSPDPNAPDFQFNESALAFAQTGLENSTHNLLISTSGDETIFVNFDYALYTFVILHVAYQFSQPSFRFEEDDTISSPLTTSFNLSTTPASSPSTTPTSATGSSIATAFSTVIASSVSTAMTSATGSSIDSSNTSNHSSTRTGAVVGSTIGGLLALCAFTFGLYVYYSRRGRKPRMHSIINTDGGKSILF
ncbi:hypothetical protein D9757_005057 [Collybiopsis confluens]|uniref:Uncharacterized protein n=1 Tax=Collybiopsis confluens TaxID=2823264 RepID=A0A8H5MCR5_9AGAR|nr:hypothetical protein D9757_005057 [Collybiopsis confluens]